MTYDEDDLETLVLRTQDGDEKAAGDLMRRIWPLATHLAKAFSLMAEGYDNSAGFDDRVQQVFLFIWEGAVPKWDPSRGTLFTSYAWWWGRAAALRWRKNQCAHFRKMKTNQESLDPLKGMWSSLRSLKEDAADVEPACEDERRELRDCLELLTDQQRLILKLRFWEDLPTRKIEAMSREGFPGLEPMSRQKVLDIEKVALNEVAAILGGRPAR